MRATSILGVIGLAAALACGRAASWPPEAAPLRAGEEVCAECRMFVSDLRFAAQTHSRDGTVEWFDDLGCLLARHAQGIEPEAVFVHDFQTDEWVRGDLGHAVRVPGLDSPMGYGWIVCASPANARSAAQGSAAETAPLSELLRPALSAEPQTAATLHPTEDRR
jgi:copper chaperone NosL